MAETGGQVTYNTHDEADFFWSLPDLADTIFELDRRFGSGKVDVIGHGLGARGVVLALAEVAHRHPDIRLRHVVLFAPDMDFGIFEHILPRIVPITESMTVHATAGDRPLALSAQLHGYPRLGEAGNDMSGLAGVKIINLSDLPTEGPTGHLYHIYSHAVGEDLRRLLNAGERADKRQDLVPYGENLWRLGPAARDWLPVGSGNDMFGNRQMHTDSVCEKHPWAPASSMVEPGT